MDKGPAPHEAAMKVLNDTKDLLRMRCAGLTPLVELPTGDLRVYKDENGEMRTVIDINQFIYVVDRLLRSVL